MKRWLAFLLVSASSLVFAQVTAPVAGLVRYGDHSVHIVYGLPGNFVVAPSTFQSATALSCASSACLVANNNVLSLLRSDGSVAGTHELDGTAPVLSLEDDPLSALAWIPAEHVLLRWSGQKFFSLPIDPAAIGGTVTSLARAGHQLASLLVTQPDRTVSRVQVSLANGAIISSDLLPGVRGPAFEIDGRVLWMDDEGLVLQDASSRVIEILPVSGNRPSEVAIDFTCERMSSGWVHLFLPSNVSDWALRLNGQQFSLTRIPAPPSAQVGSKGTVSQEKTR